MVEMHWISSEKARELAAKHEAEYPGRRYYLEKWIKFVISQNGARVEGDDVTLSFLEFEEDYFRALPSFAKATLEMSFPMSERLLMAVWYTE